MKAIYTLFLAIFFSAATALAQNRNIGFAEVTVIEMAPNGDVWAGSPGEGVAFYNAALQSWTYYSSSNTPQINSDTIYDIELAEIGGVQHSFLATAGGVSYSQATAWTSSSQMLGAKVWGVRYRPDTLWVMSNQGITTFDSSQTFRGNVASPFTPITCVQRTGTCSGIWTGTANNGIYYTDNSSSFSFIDTSMPNKNLIDNRVNAVATDPNCARVIVGTKGGLSLCPVPGPPCQNFTTSNGLPQNDITAIATDCVGRIWLGTRDSGIVIYADPLFFRLTTTQGLPSNQITTLAFTPDCKLSVGMKDGNIAIADTSKSILQILSGVGVVKEVDYNMHVFPQPSSTEINFISEREIENGEFFLSDISGRMVQQTLLGNTQKFSISVSSLVNGIYFYQIFSENQLVKRGKVEVLR